MKNMTSSLCVCWGAEGPGVSETGDELERLWPGGELTQIACLLGPCCRPSEGAFDSLRLWVLVVLCLLRLAVTRPHLQAYLCLAKARVEQLRKEAGRIEAREIQQRVCTPEGAWSWGPCLGKTTPTAASTASPPGGPGLLLCDGGEPSVPDATHPHSALHTAAQDAGCGLVEEGGAWSGGVFR